MTEKRNIIILMGGPSSEHDVSLATGKVVEDALDKSKYSVTPITISKDGMWLLPKPDQMNIGTGMDSETAIATLTASKSVDVVFIAMHGAYGEDGTIQGFLELAGVPYTGSGVLASALAMDKMKTAKLFTFHGLRVPKQLVVSSEQWKQQRTDNEHEVEMKIGSPCFVKPLRGGSSVGISLVSDNNELKSAIELALKHDDTALIEECIQGDEVTCAVLDDGNEQELIALPPIQIIPKTSAFFDYDAKYSPGASDEITPPRLPKEIIVKIQETAKTAHRIIGCSGMSRTDMIVRDGKIYVLELNTIPGMTETSLLLQAAVAAGISFPQLLDRIIQSALNRKRKEYGA